ncbi:tRNA uridine-5-carboxymethylaminomethyl(34) synthesis GTPase MnmE [Novosphingobium tardum]|uniref:tRNA modification GTPase MnmE n=1 Tax=Novosphingobium tardum TaxID=1538021 RepID=A0ABV8RKT8_9SPHN
MPDNDTIFALSSGAPPAAIAVVRISGPLAADALIALAGKLPAPRRAVAVRLWDPDNGEVLDSALALWLPGPTTATGDDIAELHLHGGRAVVAAVERSLARLPGMRVAVAGEFTRRAFANGRIDLAEAEGLADLLAAETEIQRKSAMAMAAGELSLAVSAWRISLLNLAARVEATLDFDEEDGIAGIDEAFLADASMLAAELDAWLARPQAETLREGFRVVLAGPTNAGKSTLFNKLTESEAAITSPQPGTTRDIITRTVALDGIPFLFVDTAGLRDSTSDAIEAEGMGRARAAADEADLVLWLGEAPGDSYDPMRTWKITAQIDRQGVVSDSDARHRVSSLTGEGIAALRGDLVQHGRNAMQRPGTAALNNRQRDLIGRVRDSAVRAAALADPLLIAEELRSGRAALDRLVGKVATEDMLDSLFGRFCVGK